MLREHGHHVPHWSDLLEPAEHNVGWEVSLMFFSLAVALSGIGMAYLCYIKFPELPDKIMDGQWGYDLVKNKYMVDEMYDEAIVKPTVNGSKLLWTECDAKGIDGAVNGVAQTIGWFSRLAQIYQSGYVRNYALFMVVGFISLLLIVL